MHTAEEKNTLEKNKKTTQSKSSTELSSLQVPDEKKKQNWKDPNSSIYSHVEFRDDALLQLNTIIDKGIPIPKKKARKKMGALNLGYDFQKAKDDYVFVRLDISAFNFASLKELGTVPQKRLELMWKTARSVRRPSSGGRNPVMSAWLRSSSLSSSSSFSEREEEQEYHTTIERASEEMVITILPLFVQVTCVV